MAEIRQTLEARPPLRVNVLRVNQLDADKLDSEVEALLRGQFLRAFSFFPPSLVDRIKPEITAILQLMLFRWSVWTTGTTYGNQLMNLRFENAWGGGPMTRTQQVGYALAYIGLPWGWARLSGISTSQAWGAQPDDDWRKRIWKAMGHIEKALKALSLLNFVVFLADGRYRSVVDRLLGVRLVYIRPIMMRSVSFEFMNRQLVWSGFTEFAMFLLPFLNLDKIRRTIKRRFFRAEQSVHTLAPSTTCVICMSDPITMPYVTACNHIFCYYCIKSNLLADRRFACPRCGEPTAPIRRL